ncbi:hypothetical protein SMSP2_02506 [Limihaloglobus sulfuriphilus]|uniref:Uncharacterized protein n=1 Tax=Limihaloglobus sulfuriphilus TaxID=1851148 RepID=A0A1Q2MHE0_9BACT|nr:hypothetical protein SMSP2_02506 [Limihaloglobus sulfuriphilus]
MDKHGQTHTQTADSLNTKSNDILNSQFLIKMYEVSSQTGYRRSS